MSTGDGLFTLALIAAALVVGLGFLSQAITGRWPLSEALFALALLHQPLPDAALHALTHGLGWQVGCGAALGIIPGWLAGRAMAGAERHLDAHGPPLYAAGFALPALILLTGRALEGDENSPQDCAMMWSAPAIGGKMSHYAHSRKGLPPDTWEPLGDHLEAAASCTARFASWAADWGRALGLLHDVGKASPEFLARLNGGPKVDHSTAGAVIAVIKSGAGRQNGWALRC